MGYYIRVLGLKDVSVSSSQLNDELVAEGHKGKVDVVQSSGDSWTELVLRGEHEIAVIEKNVAQPGSLGQDEIKEFLEEIEDARPESAAEWLRDYLPRVKVIYAFQLLDVKSEEDSGAMYLVLQTLKEDCEGIIQADDEGFSNPDGSQILWQFNDGVKGPWQMAVLAENGEWLTFRMELGNKKHREAFL